MIPIAIGQGEGVAAVRRQQPQVVPRTAEIGAVDETRSVRRDIGTRFPIGYIVVYLLRGGLRRIPVSVKTRSRPPEAAAAIEMIAIRHIENFTPIALPDRTDLVIERTVVIARQGTLALARETLHMGERALIEIGREEMKAAVERRGYEHQSFAVGLKTRLDVDRSVAGQRTRGAGSKIEDTQFERVRSIGNVDDPASVG